MANEKKDVRLESMVGNSQLLGQALQVRQVGMQAAQIGLDDATVGLLQKGRADQKGLYGMLRSAGDNSAYAGQSLLSQAQEHAKKTDAAYSVPQNGRTYNA